MARPDRPTDAGPEAPTVHNTGSETVTLQVLDGADGGAEVTRVAPDESASVPAATAATVEVHAPTGNATAPAAGGPSFVVRDGLFLVAPK